ncbi:tat (twin-arginine translocation) pathway signal sequence [Pandoraea terrae]|uniref:Tat (Twin-arginine translocation) pathway signal sequence n=1 Tax=Pandoraea terrae TaxID=1537710 RepID=A0A5E4XX19_9BURK|nr:tat (twin-arginine translocation) pathway signal sequence [Pandoraea terrae]VVE40916.1 tat (twin-arginine translocation) pathway signal sequence [Pandoraea terrae]
MIPMFFKPRQTEGRATADSDGEPSSIARRNVMKASALLTGVLAAQSAVGLLAPSLAWALEVKHLNQAQADAVLALIKTLYPHRNLPDAIYALAVKDVDGLAAGADGRQLVANGVRRLNAKAGGRWSKLSAEARHKIVADLIEDPFVQKVRGMCLTSLYDNELAFAHFGYQGEAFSKGGYVFRGFNDLTWLPNPPASASPALAA